LINEISVLREIEHPNVIKLYEVYESKNNIHLILELLKGGELFNQIKEKGHFSENYAAKIMKNLLTALSAIHKNNIVHRDLKPENLIFS
jgi:calcium-dependent protein kinase